MSGTVNMIEWEVSIPAVQGVIGLTLNLVVLALILQMTLYVLKPDYMFSIFFVSAFDVLS